MATNSTHQACPLPCTLLDALDSILPFDDDRPRLTRVADPLVAFLLPPRIAARVLDG